MATPSLKIAPQKSDKTRADLFDKSGSSSDVIAATHTSELVIALCGPIGSPLHEVVTKLKEGLCGQFEYTECKIIKLSEFIAEHAGTIGESIPVKPGFDRISKQISVGNKLREKNGPNVLAELAINRIRVDRELQKRASGSSRYEPRRVCHIIDSIKNQEELDPKSRD